MPRTYKPDPTKRRYKKYEPNIISAALEDLKQPHASLMEIASKYNIHKSVLYRHSQKIMKPQGGQTALSEEAELHLIENINKCAEWGYPMDTMDLRFLVKMYLDKLGVTNRRFKNNFPGVDFVQSFLNRHKNKISQRICENIKRARAAVSPDVIRNYFNELEKSLQGVELSNIINYDETNLSDDPGRKKVLMKRGCKYPERVVNHSKSSVSIMMAGTADGEMLAPYVVYKAQHLYDTWVLNGPKGTHYNRSSSGWFEGAIFEDWVEKIVIPFFKDKPGRKILIGDNLSSHLSVSLITLCREKDIEFIFLPPNSTHLTQPLDVAFFRPMKRAWREILLKWKKMDGQKQASVPKGCFPKLLKLLIEHLKTNAQKNLQAGFKKTGIHPLNIEEIMSRLPQEQNSDDVKSAVDDSVLQLLKEMRYGTINVTEPKKKRKLEVVAGRSVTAEDAGINLETNNETVAAKKSKLIEMKEKGKGKGKKTKVLTIENEKNLYTETTQKNKELPIINEQKEDEANKNNEAVIPEAEKIEAMDGLDELDINSMPFIFVESECEVITESKNYAKEEEQSYGILNEAIITVNKITDNENKNKKIKEEAKENTEKRTKNEKYPAESGSSSKTDIIFNKMNKAEINSNETGGLAQYVALKDCKPITIKDVMIEEEQSYDILNEANSTVNITQHENNLTKMERMIETKNYIDKQKIVKSDVNEKYTVIQEKEVTFESEYQNKKIKKITDNENKNKKIKEETKENAEKRTKNEKYLAESGSSSKTDININKMNKVKIISNKRGGLAQYVILKDCKPIAMKDVMKVPIKSTAKKTEIKNYYNNTKEILKVLTDSD